MPRMMGERWIKERIVLELDDQLDQAREIVMGLMHGLEAHKESSYRAIRRGDIDHVDDPVHRVTLSVEDAKKLQQLREALSKINLSMTEPETGEG